MPEIGDAPRTATTEAVVVDIVDGDTIRVLLDGQTVSVRYIGMDTVTCSWPAPAAIPLPPTGRARFCSSESWSPESAFHAVLDETAESGRRPSRGD